MTDDSSDVPMAEQHEAARRQLADRHRREPSSAASLAGAHVPVGRFSRPLELSDLRPGAVHVGRYVLCRTLVVPYKLRAVATIVQGLGGPQVRLSVYNLANEAVAGGSADVSAHCLPKGTVLAIKEPYFKKGATDEQYFIRVDTPMDILVIDDPAHPMSGNKLFGAGNFVDALYEYQLGLELLEQQQQQQQQQPRDESDAGGGGAGLSDGDTEQQGQKRYINLINNCAAACLGFQAYDSALRYACRVLESEPGNAKALMRQAKALRGLERYSEAAVAWAAFLAVQPPALDKSPARRYLQQLEQHYVGPVQVVDLDAQLDAHASGRTAGRRAGRGRGLVTTAPVKAGQLLLACKADAVCYMGEVQTMMPQFPRPGVVNGPTQSQLNRDLLPRVLGCDRLAHRLAHLHGGTRRSVPPVPSAACGYAPTVLPSALRGADAVGGAAAPEGDAGASSGQRGNSAGAASLAEAHLQWSKQGVPGGWLVQSGLLQVSSGCFTVDEAKMESITSINVFKPDKLPEIAISSSPRPGRAPDANLEEYTSASGLWSLPSYINHASFLGDFMMVRAATDLPAGAEVTFSYIDSLGTLEERVSALRKHGFKCSCELCKEDEEWSRQKGSEAREVAALLEEFNGMRGRIQAAAGDPASAAPTWWRGCGPSWRAWTRARRAGGGAWLRLGPPAAWRFCFSARCVVRCSVVQTQGGGTSPTNTLPTDAKGAVAAYERAYSYLQPSGETGDDAQLASPSAPQVALNVASIYTQIRGREAKQQVRAWEGIARKAWSVFFGSQELFNARFKDVLEVLRLCS
ncbi:hypothetical protein TSOC_002849 [Tetrabaena socialis]|uniref:SET domain-containing protein n=1 Tax=Tetrabaena socialis TaxID=47790 RepID=A0A2J8AD15_9CHLO|nr:hypothetical protein TSOC_002849 [Tetrabaena socialis]|eukprot:PNH10403.1 hypothetical protein TSOC_002849 [Tetrabaena socialis]